METARTERSGERRGLLHLLRVHMAAYLGVLALLLVVVSSATAYGLGVVQPAVERTTALTRELRLNHEALLDQETGLRAWVVTGDEALLHSYRAGKLAGEEHEERLADAVAGAPEHAAEVLDVLLAQEAWELQWAAEALRRGGSAPGADTALLVRGKALFDDYRTAYAVAIADAAAARDAAVDRQRLVLQVQAALQVFLVAVALVVVALGFRRKRRLIAHPLLELQDAIARLRRGEVLLDLPRRSVGELDEVGTALVRLSRELDRERSSSAARQARAEHLTGQLRTVLDGTRAMAACESREALLRLVVTTSAELAGAPAALWVRGAGAALSCASWSQHLAPRPERAPAVVGAAAADGRPQEGGGVLALPLIGAGAVVAVLAVDRPAAGEEVPAGLESLVLAAAAYLEALRLHEETRARATTDALTGLGNRHRMDAELAREWELSARSGAPLSFALLDLDRFKAVNDTAGHQVGDLWLQMVAEAAGAAVRAGDRVFRYGGEEIAVLLPDTAEEEAAAVLERVRAAVARLRGPEAAPRLTTSAGVAQVAPGAAGPAELVAAADRALYAAKRGGRDRVVRAGAGEAAALRA
ncbi:diguanylate cyclase domain-containing protein [Kineococcus sp. SYSU DK005]|uniref:diguanylate cyclase domain-containing protein n=1 Tax=Kineococcus sp. SYSU DK005 TaxID=3383126 RepID=UPI003D7C3AD7